jgi:hypothetical protein
MSYLKGTFAVCKIKNFLQMKIKSKGNEVLKLDETAHCLFIQYLRLYTCFQEFIDPYPDIIFQGYIYVSIVIFEDQQVAVPADAF